MRPAVLFGVLAAATVAVFLAFAGRVRVEPVAVVAAQPSPSSPAGGAPASSGSPDPVPPATAAAQPTAVVLPAPVVAAAPPTPATPDDMRGSVAPLVDRVKGAVVTIFAGKTVARVRDDWTSIFGRSRQSEQQVGIGSGFIVGKDGTVITNNHVVAGADELVVQLNDSRRFPARIVGTDPETDVAVVQITVPAGDLQVAVLGDSERLRVGDYVVAMGNPLGLGPTVTMGIVSAKNRIVNEKFGPIDDSFQDFIQTDAAINQGNSGGPLFDFQGRVVGVNTAIFNPAAAMNVGFAIPINRAQKIAEQIKQTGRIARGFLGVYGTNMPDPSAPLGAHLQVVETSSPAAAAGLRPGDVVVEFGGRPITSYRELPPAITTYKPGDKVKAVYLRGGQRFETIVTLGQRSSTSAVGQPLFLGIRGRALTAPEARKLGLPPQQGAVVVAVAERGGASGHLREGDILLEMQGRPASLADFRKLDEFLDRGGQVVITVVRNGARFYLRLG